MPTKVLVTGDCLWDVNLIEIPGAASNNMCDAVGNLKTRGFAGGAWFLGKMLKPLLDGVGEVVMPEPATEGADGTMPGGIPRAYQRCKPFPETKAEKKKTTWRIESLMGCASPRSLKALEYKGETTADVLVIDDLSLGFREDSGRWQRLVEEAKGKPIVVKMAAPPSAGGLWGYLASNTEIARKVTVVCSADVLRARGGLLSTALSWDRTIEQLEQEFRHGRSSRDLARFGQIVVLFGTEGVAWYQRAEEEKVDEADKVARFQRFLFDPAKHENVWRDGFPGNMFGRTSILTAAVVRHLAKPGDYPMCLAAGRAIAAMRKNHELGMGPATKPADLDKTLESVGRILSGADRAKDDYREPLKDFATAYPAGLAGIDPKYGVGACPNGECSILRDVVGYRCHDPNCKEDGCAHRSDLARKNNDKKAEIEQADLEALVAVGGKIVTTGVKSALPQVPMVAYGKYQTVDRNEIEAIQSIRNLITTYRSDKEARPLCIAVFGAPGSGKSFAIKQLMEELDPNAKENCLVFNLSEFQNNDDLAHALQTVRDRTIKAQVPLVFWDEFDSSELKWLKAFLSPMQDAQFTVNGHVHPLGRAIFVFAGGTCRSFEEFERPDEKACDLAKQKALKLPDFVSRLRGRLDIKGPNPWKAEIADPRTSCEELRGAQLEDPACIIRRAILLNGALDQHWPKLLKHGRVSPQVIYAFLLAGRYKNGARSIDSIVSMSNLDQESVWYGPAAIPPRHLLELHVSADFMELLEQRIPDWIDAVAKEIHGAWMAEKKRQGYLLGETRKDTGEHKTHPLLVPWEELKEGDKEGNRWTARLTIAKFRRVGLEIVEKEGPKTAVGEGLQRELTKIEHDIWLRQRVAGGWEYGEKTIDDLFLHQAIQPYPSLNPDDRTLDEAIVTASIAAIKDSGYFIRRI